MAKNNLQVEVEEATAEGQRTMTITVTGAAEDFLLADLLAQRKAIPTSTTALKNAVLEATKGYLESAEEVISGVKSEQKKDSAATGEISGKRSRKSKDEQTTGGFQLSGASAKGERMNGSIAAFSGD
jgi:hypothetical protein